MAKNTQNTKKNLTNLTLSDKKRNFLKAFENKEFNISEACKAIKVSRQTYYDWLEDDNFSNAVKDLKESDMDFTESQLRKLIKEGNVVATIFKLKTKGKDRGYDEKHQVDLFAKPFERINLEDID